MVVVGRKGGALHSLRAPDARFAVWRPLVCRGQWDAHALLPSPSTSLPTTPAFIVVVSTSLLSPQRPPLSSMALNSGRLIKFVELVSRPTTAPVRDFADAVLCTEFPT